MFKTTNIESLSDDVIFDILVRVPAQDIYDAARLVCRKWHKMIHTHNFIHAHLSQSTCGLLIQNQSYIGRKPNSVTMQIKGRIEISKMSCKIEPRVWSSCNGLILELHENYIDLYITNPVTKQHFSVPRFFFGKIITHDHCAI
ncbi:hypothetical protein PHJA_001642200 [Phtheirospermum japonicum]|uniref:F-box domain-containing protein n=1 Tax=Phtheirospermum japonicum TaxID=374723 RepID=A0A830CD79_9LAMI|nr:hypothetical protein PHJA_001642200 [Phtheirospermum japonicum]